MSWGFCFLCRLLLSDFFHTFFAHVQNVLFILSLDDFQFNQKHKITPYMPKLSIDCSFVVVPCIVCIHMYCISLCRYIHKRQPIICQSKHKYGQYVYSTIRTKQKQCDRVKILLFQSHVWKLSWKSVKIRTEIATKMVLTEWNFILDQNSKWRMRL